MLLILLTTLAVTSASYWQSDLQEFGLETVAKDSVYIGRGRIKRMVELNDKETDDEKPIICNLPNGKPGICKPLKHCSHDGTKGNILKYVATLCIRYNMNNDIGTCCPDKSIEYGPEKLAGALPAVANKDEDDVLKKIMRVENRGCGLSTRPRGQLIEAGPAKLREWPWMASIAIRHTEHSCGGVLITNTHVLTAAHCFNKINASKLVIRLGEYDFQQSNETRHYSFDVVEKIEHDEFDHITNFNDIAILKMNRSVVFTTYVWPICLPPVGLELVNETTVLTGWGTIRIGGPISPVLLEVGMPVWHQQACRDSLTDTVFDEYYCVGSYTGGKDACQYDSGSPLMYELPSGRWVAVGVVSWGVNCGEANHPGLYTRIDKYLPWIIANTKE